MDKLAQDNSGYRPPKSRPAKSVPSTSDVKKPGQIKQDKETVKQKATQKVLSSQTANIRKMQSDILSLMSLVNKKDDRIKAIINARGTNLDLNSILDSINSETFSIDGKWGKQTYDALNSIYKLTFALLNTDAGYMLNAEGYNVESLNNLRHLLNGYKLDDNNRNSEELKIQAKRAELISQHIVAIMNFFNDIVHKINTDERLSSNTVLDEYRQMHETLTDEESVTLKNYSEQPMSFKVPYNGQEVQISMPLKSLSNPKSFEEWFALNKEKVSALQQFDNAQVFFNQVISQNKWV